MPNPTIIPKKSVQSGAVPPTLALGEIAINHADRRLYSRNPATGEIYKLAGAGEAPDRVFVFDSAGDTTYLGYLLYSDVPSTGSIYDAADWEISRTQFSADGNSSTEASATGSWNSRSSLQFS
ncbi:MAG: hypothetical protein NTW41_05500 [Verrucomicrobia bacterium]|nr:hypothetical protein [Verrucomicrobiota bacterium]